MYHNVAHCLRRLAITVGSTVAWLLVAVICFTYVMLYFETMDVDNSPVAEISSQLATGQL